MNRTVVFGAIIGAAWALLTSPVLLDPGVRESVRLLLGKSMTFSLPILPIAWVVGVFEASVQHLSIWQIWLVTSLTGGGVGAFVGFLVKLLRGQPSRSL